MQQFIILGNYLHLFLNKSPTGENASTICKFSLQVCTKNAYTYSLLSPLLASLALAPISSQIDTFSSYGKRFGISPEFKRLFISSRKDSLTI